LFSKLKQKRSVGLTVVQQSLPEVSVSSTLLTQISSN
jgi:hypothetical protein